MNVGWVHCTKGHYGLRKYFDTVPLVFLSQRWKLESSYPHFNKTFFFALYALIVSKVKYFQIQNILHVKSHILANPSNHQQIGKTQPTITPLTTHTTNRSEQNHPPPLYRPHKSMCWRGKEKTSRSTTHCNPQSQPPPCPSHPTKIHKPSLKIEIGKPQAQATLKI